MLGGVPGGFFSGGAVGISVGAHLAREGFVAADKQIASTQAAADKGAHVRVVGDLVKDGFERIGRQLKQTQGEAEKTGAAFKTSFDSAGRAVSESAGVITDRLGVVQGELRSTRKDFLTVADAASYTADQVDKAAAREVAAAKASEDAHKKAAMAAGGAGGAGGGTIIGKGGADNADKAGKAAGDSWKKGFEKTANLGKWVALGAAGLGIVSIKVAADFQRQMETIHTEAGYSQRSVKELTGQVEKLAPAVGIGPTKLAEGLFHLASAGVPASQAMEVLTKAAQLSKVGLSDMDETTYALVSLLKTAPKDIHNASEAVGVMNDIVGHGDLRMKDLVSALGSGLVPAAKAVGLGLRDTGAALDVLTARGIPAEQAATRLRTTLGLVAHPTAKAQKALEELGIQHSDLAKEFEKHGITGALEFLQSHLDKAFPKGRSLTIEEQKDAVKKYAHSLEEAGIEGKTQAKSVEQFEKKLKETGTAAIQQSAIIAEAFGGARIGTTWQILMQNIDDVRKHQEDLNKDNAAKRFDERWKETEEEFSVKASKIGAWFQEIGVKIGNWAIPKVEDFVKALDKVGKWLGDHKAVLDGLVIFFGVTLALAVTAFFAKVTLGMGRALKEMGMFLGVVNKAPSDVETSTEKIVASVEAQTKAFQDLTVAASEADAAMGGGIGMGRLAGTGEDVTAGGVVLPRGQSSYNRYVKSKSGFTYLNRGDKIPGMTPAEGQVALAEEEAAMSAGGVVPPSRFSKLGKGLSLPSGMKGLSQRAGQGLFLGLGISMASGILGEMIGGKGGKAVSSIGGSAAAGAGLGMILGPEGAIAGGVLGGIIGGFKQFLGKSESWGEKIAHGAAKGMRKEIGDKLAHELDDAQKKFEDNKKQKEEQNRKKEEQAHPRHRLPGARGAHGHTELTPQQERELREEKIAHEQATGRSFATSALHEQLGVEKGLSPQDKLTGIVNFVVPRLKNLPAQAQAAGVQTLIALVKGMESKKQLPPHAVQELVMALGNEYPKLKTLAKKTGEESMKAMADTQKGENVLKETHKFFELMRNAYKGWEKFPALTAENAQELFLRANQKLQHEEQNANDAKREGARKDRERLKKEEEAWYDARIENVDQRLHDLNKKGASKTKKGNEEIEQLYRLRATIMTEETAAGAASVEEAEDKINEQFLKEMKALGVSAKDVKKTTSALKGVATSTGKALDKFFKNAAGGGIPHPGSGAGDDHILIDPSGTPVAAMSGTEGIINTPQMHHIDVSLALSKAMGVSPYGSLDELWGSGMTHYAKGGQLPPTPLARANFLQSLHLPYVWGGHHGDRLITNPSPGLDCSSTVSYVLGIPPKVSGEFEHYGKPGPGAITIFSNPEHVFMRLGARYFGTSGFGHPRIGGGPGWFEVPPSAEYLKRFVVTHVDGAFAGGMEPGLISEPRYHGPEGMVGDISKAIIKRETGAANDRLQQLFNSMGNSEGQGLTDSVAPVPGIMKIAEEAAKAAGVPFNSSIVRVLLSKESGGGRDLPPHDFGGGLDPAGPFQVIGSTFAAYAAKGHTNRMNPLDNALAAFRYIKSRYHTLPALAAATGLMGPNYKGYRLGGLMRRLAGGGMAHDAANHISVGSPRKRGPAGTLGIGKHHRNPNQKIAGKLHGNPPKAPSSRPGGKQVTSASSLKAAKSLGAFAKEYGLHAGVELDAADAEIANYDSKYSQEQGYFQLIDSTLTPADERELLAIRNTQFGVLKHVRELEAGSGQELHQLVAYEKEELVAPGEAVATGLLKEMEANKKKLINQGRKLAKLRHDRAGKVMKLAEELAKKHEVYMNRKEKNAERAHAIREQYRTKREAWKRRKPEANKAAKEGVKNRAKAELMHAGKLSTREAIKARERGELSRLDAADKGSHKRWSEEGMSIGRAERSALKPVENEDRQLKKHFRHQSETEKRYRQKYARQGWAQAWGYEVDKWHLQDKIKEEQRREKELTGKTDPTVQEITETTKGTLGGFHKELATGEKQLANLTAIEEKTPTEELEVAKDIVAGDIAAGIPIPQEVIDVFTKAGLPAPSGLKAYQEGARKGEVGEEGGGGTAGEAARLALQELAALDASNQQLYQQFGSNSVSQANLSAALLGIGTGGVKAFGAQAGLAGSAGIGQPPSTKTFNQYNTYAVGPENPHVHAQQSAAEFQSRFG